MLLIKLWRLLGLYGNSFANLPTSICRQIVTTQGNIFLTSSAYPYKRFKRKNGYKPPVDLLEVHLLRYEYGCRFSESKYFQSAKPPRETYFHKYVDKSVIRINLPSVGFLNQNISDFLEKLGITNHEIIELLFLSKDVVNICHHTQMSFGGIHCSLIDYIANIFHLFN